MLVVQRAAGERGLRSLHHGPITSTSRTPLKTGGSPAPHPWYGRMEAIAHNMQPETLSCNMFWSTGSETSPVATSGRWQQKRSG